MWNLVNILSHTLLNHNALSGRVCSNSDVQFVFPGYLQSLLICETIEIVHVGKVILSFTKD